MRILYVEDHEDTAFVIGKLLRSMGHDVLTAHTCREARVMLQTNPFDVLLSDLSLPDGHGCDLMREVAAALDVPGIAITGFGMQGDVDAALAADFSQHLVKPLDFTQLEGALNRVAMRSTLLPHPQDYAGNARPQI